MRLWNRHRWDSSPLVGGLRRGLRTLPLRTNALRCGDGMERALPSSLGKESLFFGIVLNGALLGVRSFLRDHHRDKLFVIDHLYSVVGVFQLVAVA